MGRWGFASCVSGGPARRKSRPVPWKSPPARLKPSSSAIWKRPPGCAEIPPWPWRCCSGGTVRVVRILGIESSCDETAAAVVENGEALQSAGFDTVLCADLRSAREALAREGSVLIVLDI